MHRHRYHGVLAPNAMLRAAVVAIGRPKVTVSDLSLASPTPILLAPRQGRTRPAGERGTHPLGHAPRTNLWRAAFALPRLWWLAEDPR